MIAGCLSQHRMNLILEANFDLFKEMDKDFNQQLHFILALGQI